MPRNSKHAIEFLTPFSFYSRFLFLQWDDSNLTFYLTFCEAEMYPGFQIMGSSGPLLENFGGPLQSFGGPANL